MFRRFAFVLVPVVIGLGVWLLLRNGDNEPIPVVADEPAAAAVVQPANVLTADVAGSAAPAEAAVERSAATSESDQPPIPADAKWVEVLVVDAGTQQPVAGAEVRWSDASAYEKLHALPAKEQQAFTRDPELLTLRFGWHKRSDARGMARITNDGSGAVVHAYADGRYAVGYVGGQEAPPPAGWRLELEPDRTLRAKVLDRAGQPATGVQVGIRMAGEDGKAIMLSGWISGMTTKAPDGIAEFRHIQNWLRWGGAKKQQFEVTTWRVALDVPGHEDPGVEFDEQSPPSEPIVLHLPVTGRLTARLLHAGQPVREGVTFAAYRGAANDSNASNGAQRIAVDDDGWARLQRVALGGTLVVQAQWGSVEVNGTAPGPTGDGQEVRVELRTDDLFGLAGRLLGPDGKAIANEHVNSDFDLGITGGGGMLETDSEGRFLWLLTESDQ